MLSFLIVLAFNVVLGQDSYDNEAKSTIENNITPVIGAITFIAAIFGTCRVSWAFFNQDDNAKVMLRRLIYTIVVMSCATAFSHMLVKWANS